MIKFKVHGHHPEKDPAMALIATAVDDISTTNSPQLAEIVSNQAATKTTAKLCGQVTQLQKQLNPANK
jgi:hypothetical protein